MTNFDKFIEELTPEWFIQGDLATLICKGCPAYCGHRWGGECLGVTDETCADNCREKFLDYCSGRVNILPNYYMKKHEGDTIFTVWKSCLTPKKFVDSINHFFLFKERCPVFKESGECEGECHPSYCQMNFLKWATSGCSPDNEQPDMVNHPSHYTSGGIECIDVIKAALLDKPYNGFVACCIGNVIKYIYRAGKKGDTIQDLKKAQWYLNKAIQEQKGEKEC